MNRLAVLNTIGEMLKVILVICVFAAVILGIINLFGTMALTYMFTAVGIFAVLAWWFCDEYLEQLSKVKDNDC